jgi:dihydrofolate synthase / folylpolyglutamate synthase
VDYQAALEYLDSHASYEKTGRIDSPSLDTISRLMDAMGEPQRAYRVIHITGTNGKGSTAQMITRLLMARGLSVGTYTSPHLERVNERIACNGTLIDDEAFGEMVGAVADMEVLSGARPGYFDTLTAAAFRWFADVAVDVAVVEVGLLGRWDATNVVHADVCVITNIGLEHTEFAGPTEAHVLREKVGILKPDAAVVCGVSEQSLVEIVLAEAAAVGAGPVYVRGEHFDCMDNELALGGRSLMLRTPTSMYSDVFLALNGEHQGDNAAAALTAVEAFFDAALDHGVVAEAFAEAVMPGRFEVLGHQPLVIVDGAHNAHGADRCAEVFFNDFAPAGEKVLVAGFLRDPKPMLEALRADEFDRVYCCAPPSPRAVDVDRAVAAAKEIGCEYVVRCDSVAQACNRALASVTAEDAVLVAGSLYVIGEARPHLKVVLP